MVAWETSNGGSRESLALSVLSRTYSGSDRFGQFLTLNLNFPLFPLSFPFFPLPIFHLPPPAIIEVEHSAAAFLRFRAASAG